MKQYLVLAAALAGSSLQTALAAPCIPDNQYHGQSMQLAASSLGKALDAASGSNKGTILSQAPGMPQWRNAMLRGMARQFPDDKLIQQLSEDLKELEKQQSAYDNSCEIPLSK